MAVVVMVPLDVSDRNLASRLRQCDSGEGNCRESGDEFDLVHGVVPFFACCSVFRQMEDPIRPQIRPPRSEAPIPHQSSVWRVVLWWCAWCFGS